MCEATFGEVRIDACDISCFSLFIPEYELILLFYILLSVL